MAFGLHVTFRDRLQDCETVRIAFVLQVVVWICVVSVRVAWVLLSVVSLVWVCVVRAVVAVILCVVGHVGVGRGVVRSGWLLPNLGYCSNQRPSLDVSWLVVSAAGVVALTAGNACVACTARSNSMRLDMSSGYLNDRSARGCLLRPSSRGIFFTSIPPLEGYVSLERLIYKSYAPYLTHSLNVSERYRFRSCRPTYPDRAK